MAPEAAIAQDKVKNMGDHPPADLEFSPEALARCKADVAEELPKVYAKWIEADKYGGLDEQSQASRETSCHLPHGCSLWATASS